MAKVLGFAIATVMAASASVAHAAWYRASSQHFIIYSEQKPEDLRQFAQELEKFDRAVRFVRGMDDLPPSQGNRLTVFAFRYVDPIQKLIGDKSHMVAGFYRGSAGGSVAYVSLGDTPDPEEDTPIGSHVVQRSVYALHDDTVLLHEYAHHLMFQDLASPYPQWLVEGFAEFMSTAHFNADGSVGLGLPATHRAAGLLLGQQLPLETLLSGHYQDMSADEVESLYGRGWLLTHYLTFEPSRQGQLNDYVSKLAHGIEPLQAARESFGDLKQLDRDLEDYLHRPKLRYVTVAPAKLKIGTIEITRLSDPESDAIPILMALKNNPDAKEARALVPHIQEIEQRSAGDALIEDALAEADLRCDDAASALTAAERALQTDNQNTKAMVLKGLATEALAEKLQGPARHSGFETARNLFIAANKIDTEDPEPLMEFYRAFVSEGVAPNTNAVAALHYASDLAPQDEGLRLTSAMQFLADGKSIDARRSLIPIAYDPHGGNFSNMAKTMVAKIDSGDVDGALAVARQDSASGNQSSSR